MSSWVLVFLFGTLLNFAHCTATHSRNETDRFALLAFKANLHDPQGVLSSWNSSVHFCKWHGVTCGRMHKRVVILNLTSSDLSGSLSPHIGNLSFLKQFILNENNFVGNIPNEIGRLFRLQSLWLGNNSFDGEIPVNISHCMRLEELQLRSNKLVGEIPTELGSMTRLTKLGISYNNLTGRIPSFIGNLTSLENLFALSNNFWGNIPSTLGELLNSKKIGLGDNKLSGTLPSSIYNLSSLVVLGLYNNELVGILPHDLGICLPLIQEVNAWDNLFNGTIPPSLSNATTLLLLDLSNNRFTGKIPNFGSLRNLEFLSFNNNYLGTGEGDDEMSVLIDSLINCTSLNTIQIDFNNLRGTLPNSVGNLSTQAQVFSISNNRLYGVIPLGLGNLLNLEVIHFGENQFEGQIPNNICKLQKLNALYLDTTQLSGPIPFSLGNMSMLSRLVLRNNKLEGTIPSSLGKCKNLLRLDLSNNNLTGTIRKGLFDASSLSILLDLSNNRLLGPIPSEVGKLVHLVRLLMSQNELSGEIPTALSFCTGLVDLWLTNNFLNGSIPLTLKTLGSLQTLDLSNNNLSGMVPKFLENFPLKAINISHNNLVGELPTQGVFANASEIFVDGNSLLCGGIPDLRLPKCKTGKSKHTRSLLQIILISIGCFVLAVSMILLSIYFWMKNKRREQPSSSSPKESFLKVSYGDLVKATNGFSSTNIIGLGSFGSVYKGVLHLNEMMVAVKVLNLERCGATKSFMAECKAWRNIRHRNLLKIITSCSSTDFNGNDFMALVYEFMPNGSLGRWLHSDEEKLNLHQRIDIGVDVAYALDYLHHGCGDSIIHCDLKPSNVLLDEDMVAHVGDFGLAKFATIDSFSANQSQSTGVKGTIGYAAPEYGMGNEASKNGDIYSYGILLLEMITGKSPTDPIFSGGLSLHNYAMQALSNNFIEFVVPQLLHIDEEDVPQVAILNDNIIKDCIVSILKIGVACSVESPQDRMNLNEVIRQLQSIKNTLGDRSLRCS